MPLMSETSARTPWDDLDEQGTGLTVDAFITTLMSQVGNALRRKLTVPYAGQFGLSVSEWRLLALVAHAGAGGLPFAELVVQSTSDKALVSRTLKLLEQRGLVRLVAEGNTPRKKLHCQITPEGEALHREAIPIARARQAAAIRSIPPELRHDMYLALLHLREYCQRIDVPEATTGDLHGLDI